MTDTKQDPNSQMQKARRLGLICGGGLFPAEVARAAQLNGYDILALLIRDNEAPGMEAYPHMHVRIAEVGKMLKKLRDQHIQDVCLIGHLKRPSLSSLRPDWGAVRYIPDFIPLFQGGDNHLLAGIVRFLEAQGFHVKGAHEVAPHLLAKAGETGQHSPTKDTLNDIEKGQQLLQALSPFDIGQGVVIHRGRVLAVEGPEGTKSMLARVSELLPKKGEGVFLKGPKAGQDWRIDLPAVGPDTVKEVAAAGLAGIAIQAGGVLMLEPENMQKLADENCLFIHGWNPQDGR